ncbi:MAG: carbohydrate ABC transporter permease [Spirochaetaceae bacterium]|jgi:multiple sugar transport system permease protein|nr:carbohydrate ABC transporter permease [Spirochaetaceae bacterium]
MKQAFAYLNAKRFVIYGFMLLLLLLAVLPVYIMTINATRSTNQINLGLSLIPGTNILFNWEILTRHGVDIGQGFINSSIVSFSTVILAIYFTALTAYGLHCYHFPGRRIIWTVILVTMMLPASLGFIGFYQFMALLKLTNNYLPLIIPAIAGSATVLFIRQYMSSMLSVELIDAARIDGAGEFRIFNQIVIPIISPALAAQAIFTFVGSWNNFFTPFVLISNQKKYTLPLQINLLRSDLYRTEFGAIYLGLAISIIPIIIFFCFVSRYIISGITLGGIKE